jgi:hypothetical protein
MGLPIASPENIYETCVELTKAADFAAPNRFWTDPKTLPPAPPPPPPEGVIKAQIDAASKEKIAAGHIMQQEVESRRKAELEKYAIDSNIGLHIAGKQVDHHHAIAIEGLKASHAALLTAMEAKIDPMNKAATSTSDAVKGATGEIQKHGVSLDAVNTTLSQVFDHVKKAGAIATGHKRIRKNAKGEVEGVDIFHPETGALLASHKAVKDHNGRIVGME